MLQSGFEFGSLQYHIFLYCDVSLKSYDINCSENFMRAFHLYIESSYLTLVRIFRKQVGYFVPYSQKISEMCLLL
jgi:hypothetical protein